MKTLTQLITTIVLLCSTQVLAANHWYLPEGLKAFRVQNLSQDTIYLYLSGPAQAGSAIDEEILEIPGFGMITYDLQSKPVHGFYLLKSYDEISANVFLSHNGTSWARASSGRSNDFELLGNKQDSSTELTIANTSPISQEGDILVSSPQGGRIHFQLNPFEQKKFDFTWAAKSSVHIHGQYALAVAAVVNNKSWPVLSRKSTVPSTQEATAVYFLMGSSSDWDSFIVKLTDANLINQARAQIATPNAGLPSILIADIQYGDDGYNRDSLSYLNTNWSWSVKKVYGFRSAALNDCNGSPSIVEDFLEPWISSQNKICFYRYKVIKELK